MPLVLRRVGRYEILREVGRGGMGVVYLARQTDLDREVALKELAASHLADPAFAKRFVRESKLAAALNHPNVVTVHDFFEHNGVPYIAMEYVERGSLRPWVGRITLAQIAGVLEGLLAGLSHACTRGVVHRDLKPENVMITEDGRVKIADFGIAKAYNNAVTSGFFPTDTRTAVGTPTYMAPEQAMAKEVGPWTDLYSAGVMAYELVVGRVPFQETDVVAMLLQHVNERPPSPRSIDPHLDPRLSDWIEQLLEKKPEDRPPSASTAWEDLENIIDAVLGHSWRKEARLIERVADTETPKPLTPAVFTDQPASGFVTYHPGASDDESPVIAFETPGRASGAPAGTPAPADEIARVAPEELAAVEVDAPPEGVMPLAGSVELEPPPTDGSRDAEAGPEVAEQQEPSGDAEPQTQEPGSEVSLAPVDEFVTYRPAEPEPAEPGEPDDAAAAHEPVDEDSELGLPALPSAEDEPPASSRDFVTYKPSGPEPEPVTEEPIEVSEPEPVALATPPPDDQAPSPAALDEPEPEPVAAATAAAADADEPRAPADLDPADVGAAVTIPPTRRQGESFQLPSVEPRTERRWIWPVAVGAALALVGAAIAIVVTRSGSNETSSTVQSSVTVPPDGRVPAAEQARLAVSDSAVYVSAPSGHVARLGGLSLRPDRQLLDPARPRDLTLAGNTLYVAEDATLSSYRADTLEPVDARAYRASTLVGGDDGVVAVLPSGSGTSRLCQLSGRCTGLGFVPTGAGAAQGRVFLADGKSGTLRVVPAATLVVAPAIRVGTNPHGRIVEFLDRLYVPIDRGVAVVDLSSRRLVRTISLPGTPSDISIVPTNGILVAALYHQKQLAAVDTASPTDPPRLIPVPGRPVAIAPAPGVGTRRGDIYAVLARPWRVVRINARTGRQLKALRLGSFTREAEPLVAMPPRFVARGNAVIATIPFNGRVDRAQLRAVDRTIRDGHASFELWQGGILTRAGPPTTRQDVALAIVRKPGRLLMDVKTPKGAFESVATRLSSGAILITLVKTEHVVVPTPTVPPQATTGPQPSPTAPPRATATPRPPPTATPKPEPTIEIG
jgi:hypothetical protein